MVAHQLTLWNLSLLVGILSEGLQLRLAYDVVHHILLLLLIGIELLH